MKLRSVYVAFGISATSIVLLTSHPAASKSLAGGPILWKSVRAGMTEAQVRAVLPGLKADGRPATLVGPNTDVAGQSFQVNIGFTDDRVAYVALGRESAIIAPIKEALTVKYGAPIEPFGCRMSASMQICGGKWKAAGMVQISLSSTQLEAGSITTINYEVPDTSGI